MGQHEHRRRGRLDRLSYHHSIPPLSPSADESSPTASVQFPRLSRAVRFALLARSWSSDVLEKELALAVPQDVHWFVDHYFEWVEGETDDFDEVEIGYWPVAKLFGTLFGKDAGKIAGVFSVFALSGWLHHQGPFPPPLLLPH